MKRYMLFLLSTAVFVFAFVSPAVADDFRLLAAQRLEGAGEIATAAAPAANGGGGFLFYNQNVFVPEDLNVLLVHISATGDVHSGSIRGTAVPGGQMDLACLVNNMICNEPFTQFVPFFTPTGWVSVLRTRINPYAGSYNGDGGGGAGDWHDNNINQTWCKALPKHEDGTVVNVKLKLGSNPLTGGGTAFLDNVKVYVEGAKVNKKNRALACTTKRAVP